MVQITPFIRFRIALVIRDTTRYTERNASISQTEIGKR